MNSPFRLTKWRQAVAISAALLFPACPGWTDTTSADHDTAGQSIRQLTLAEAKRLAFLNNWDLLAARSDVDAATAQKIVARAFPNPTLSLSTTKISVDSSYPSSTSAGNGFWERSYDSVAAINQLFEIGGKRSSRSQSAAAGVKAAEARLLDARRVLDQAITRAYVNALLAEASTGILTQSATSLRREADIAETRLRAGDISSADKNQIEMAADRLELDAQTARANASSGRIAVDVLLGIPHPSGQWTAGDSLEQLAGESVVEPEDSEIARPDWLAAQATLQKTEADLRLQKAMRIPDPTVLFQYEHEPPDQPNTIGFGLSFPLPLWNRNRGNIQAAQAARDQAQEQVKKIQAQIAAEIASARVAYGDSASRLRRYREQIEPRSEAIKKAVFFAYDKGAASLIDLLSAGRNDNDVRLATAQAAADTVTAAANLRAALNSGGGGGPTP